MQRTKSLIIFITLVLLGSHLLPQAHAQPHGEKQRGFFPYPNQPPAPGVQGSEDISPLQPPPSVPEPDLPELSIQALKRLPQDSRIIAVLDNEKLTYGDVRVAAFLLRRSAPELTQEDAFDHALFEAVIQLVHYAEAVKQKRILPLAEATQFANEQRESCQADQECIELTAAVASALGLSADQYWSAQRYQRVLTTDIMVGNAMKSIAPTDPEQMQKSQNLQKQIARSAPIRWLDPHLAKQFPDTIAKMKPVALWKHTVKIYDVEME